MFMKKFICIYIFPALLFLFLTVPGNTQTEKRLFESDSILQITLSGNIRDVLNDRGDNPQYHPLTVSYKKEDGTDFFLNTETKTRGHFRKLKENCMYPPLLLHFNKSDTLNASVFKEQDKIKLVVPCQGDDYVVREWLVYKLYNLITPKSFRARLTSVTLNDTKNKKTTAPFYSILIEEESQMAKRNNEVSVTRKLRPQETDEDAFINMAVFEYMIGNTDWSVQFLQNIKLLAVDSTSIATTVAYDFDHAGIVDAPYAKPAEELEMNSVRERRYRGYCIQDMKKFDAAIALFNKLKDDIYKVYTSCTLLDAKYIKTTVKYLDDFYKTINTPSLLQKEFGYPCDPNGTGNVVIKGLREE